MARREDEDRRWQPPDRDAKGSEKMAWVNDVVSCGEQFNASLTSGRDVAKAIAMIAGQDEKIPNQSRSNMSMNREKRALREVVANISDIRAVDAYSSDNPTYQDYLGMMNKVGKAVLYEGKFNTAFKRAVQWLVAGGYSFISPVYPQHAATGKKRTAHLLLILTLAMTLFPFQMPDDNSVQGTYAWTRIRFMPEFEAHSKFYWAQSKLRPVARRRYSGNAAKDRISLAERFRAGSTPSLGNWAAEMDEIRYTTKCGGLVDQHNQEAYSDG